MNFQWRGPKKLLWSHVKLLLEMPSPCCHFADRVKPEPGGGLDGKPRAFFAFDDVATYRTVVWFCVHGAK